MRPAPATTAWRFHRGRHPGASVLTTMVEGHLDARHRPPSPRSPRPCDEAASETGPTGPWAADDPGHGKGLAHTGPQPPDSLEGTTGLEPAAPPSTHSVVVEETSAHRLHRRLSLHVDIFGNGDHNLEDAGILLYFVRPFLAHQSASERERARKGDSRCGTFSVRSARDRADNMWGSGPIPPRAHVASLVRARPP